MKPIRMYLSKNISKEEFLDRFGPLVDENEFGLLDDKEEELVYDYADLIEVSMDKDGTLKGVVVLLNGQFLRNYTGEYLDHFKQTYRARQEEIRYWGNITAYTVNSDDDD
jgi:hypothetical protein